MHCQSELVLQSPIQLWTNLNFCTKLNIYNITSTLAVMYNNVLIFCEL